jgi:steroid 5-alpha reductase family enzyme
VLVNHELSQSVGDQGVRPWLLLALVAVWGGRLAWHISRRARGAGEDPRYVQLMAGGGSLVRKVLLPQGLAIWFVSLPIQVSAVTTGDIGIWTWLGVALWLLGMVFEAVGDAQLAAYKRDPDRPPVMDRGLWRYTRHPNYFGDACVWWGIWLVATDAWPGVLTVLSPLAMTFFLVFATGAKLLERTMMKRPGYPEYARRTSMFFPLPPRKA